MWKLKRHFLWDTANHPGSSLSVISKLLANRKAFWLVSFYVNTPLRTQNLSSKVKDIESYFRCWCKPLISGFSTDLYCVLIPVLHSLIFCLLWLLPFSATISTARVSRGWESKRPHVFLPANYSNMLLVCWSPKSESDEELGWFM